MLFFFYKINLVVDCSFNFDIFYHAHKVDIEFDCFTHTHITILEERKLNYAFLNSHFSYHPDRQTD